MAGSLFLDLFLAHLAALRWYHCSYNLESLMLSEDIAACTGRYSHATTCLLLKKPDHGSLPLIDAYYAANEASSCSSSPFHVCLVAFGNLCHRRLVTRLRRHFYADRLIWRR